MCVTNRGLKLMGEWLTHPLVREYSLASDWDDRWRTGGTVDEVIEEAHLDPKHILAGIERFVRERPARIQRLRDAVEAIDRG
jgi:transketolase